MRQGKVFFAGQEAGIIREFDDYYEFLYNKEYLPSKNA